MQPRRAPTSPDGAGRKGTPTSGRHSPPQAGGGKDPDFGGGSPLGRDPGVYHAPVKRVGTGELGAINRCADPKKRSAVRRPAGSAAGHGNPTSPDGAGRKGTPTSGQSSRWGPAQPAAGGRREGPRLWGWFASRPGPRRVPRTRQARGNRRTGCDKPVRQAELGAITGSAGRNWVRYPDLLAGTGCDIRIGWPELGAISGSAGRNWVRYPDRLTGIGCNIRIG